MKVQIEITTRCNFNCFYCVGRNMVQADMPFRLFETILDDHVSQYGVPEEVSLQGEGEPTLHKDFFAMAKRILQIGSKPYTITNGSFSRPESFWGLFSTIGVSLDTLNPETSEKIGRLNLSKTLSFIQEVRKRVHVNVYTVAIAPDVRRISEFCRVHGLKHIVQHLQAKPDYRYRYEDKSTRFSRPEPFSCRFLRDPVMRYYNLDGVVMPCCFIKNTTDLPPLNVMEDMESRRIMPKVCSGCHFGLKK